MGNIPNTNTPNLVLQSVGNGSNDSRWGTSGGGSGITQLTGDVTAGPGSGSQAATVAKIQGKTVSTTAPTDAQIFIWNSTTSQWVPQTINNDLSITNSGVATLTGINGKAIPSSTASTGGEILYYNQTSNTWLYGGLQAGSVAPTVNQVLTWQSGSGWTAVTPTGGSGLGNNDAGNLYLSTAQAQAQNLRRYPVDALGGSYATNYPARGAMTYTTTGASAGLVVGTNGVYHITGQIAITPAVALSQLQAQIVAGGSQIATSQAGSVPASQNEFLQVSCDYYLTSGTLIQLAWYFTNTSGTTTKTLITGGANTFISAHLVSS
jgi:hypothetical protein